MIKYDIPFIFLIEFFEDVFINYQTPGDTVDKDYIEKDEPVMVCNCPPACEYFSYETSMVALPINKKDDITLDVHFEAPTSIRYRTEIVFSTQDIVGNFLNII